MTLAIPTTRKQPFLSGLQWALLLGGGFVIFLYAVIHVTAKQDRDDRTKLISELNGGTLSTPDGFQSRCGKPKSIRKGKDGEVLDYGSVLVSFNASAASLRRNVGTAGLPDGMPADNGWAFDQLNCKLGR